MELTRSIKKFSMVVPGFGIRTFLIAVVIVWLLLGYLAQMSGQLAAPLWMTSGLRFLSYVLGVILVALIGYGLWGVVVRLGLFLWSLVSQTESVDIDLETPQETTEVKQTLSALSRTLAQLETDSSKAALLLSDAGEYTGHLVALVKGIALKTETMRDEIKGLQAALKAISTGDPLQIARVAGQIKDRHIRELMLCQVQTPDYWTSVARLVATQLGTLEQWTLGYDRFAISLLTEVAGLKARLAAMTASLELASATRPLLQIQGNLDEARLCLQFECRPELSRAVEALPTINAGLLR